MSKSVTSKLQKIQDSYSNFALEDIINSLSIYRAFFDNYSEAVFIINSDNLSIFDANENAAKLFGITKKALTGSIIPQFRRILKLLHRNESPVVLTELTVTDKNNNDILLEISARFFDYQGQKLIQAVARNITEQFQLTDRLVQSDKLVLLGQMIASVAHEVRNPLAAINLNLQILQRKFDESTDERNNIDTALQGVDRITKIVNATLSFSRTTNPTIERINLNDVIPTSVDIFTTSIRKKNIVLTLDLDQSLPLVEADEKHMLQVIANLIKNAIDSINVQGEIEIKTYFEQGTTDDKDNFVVVAVKDSGCGIHPDDITRIFNPFFTKKDEGTGLGLPISQRLIHQYNGMIDVDSNLGKGTTIYIKLPAVINK